MVEIKNSCSDCGKTIEVTIEQIVIDSRLGWYESSRCFFCKSALEADGIGMLSESVRELILEQEGEWQLIVNSTDSKIKVKLFKIIRQALNLSLKEISTLQNTFPCIVSGTKMEMKWLKQLLLDTQIDSFIEKIDSLESNLVFKIISNVP